MYIFLGIIFFIGVVIFLIIQIAINNTKTNGVEYKVQSKVILENNAHIGDDVNFWLNPRNNKINIYFKGSVGGQGKIGEINSIPDLEKFEEDQLNAKICKITTNSVFIKFY